MTQPEVADQQLGRLAGAVGRGALVTAAFSISLQALTFAQSLVVPRLLGPENLGLFAVAAASVRIGTLLKDFGVSEKLTQEDRVDLPLAYSVAFTLEAGLATLLFLGLVATAPVVAAVLDRPDLSLVISVLAFTVYTNAFLNLTGALHLRRLHYGRLNLVTAVGPIVSFIVTVPLAFAGAGVWALVGGAVAAFVAAAAVVFWTAPLRPRPRLDRGVVREYLQFGWPLWIANLLGLASTVGGSIVITRWIGFAGVGFFAVTQGFVQRAFLVDMLVAQSLFPALSRTQDDVAGHRRAFLITNRVTVIWSGLVGFGLAVFGDELVHHVFGDAWTPAIFLFRMTGLAVAIGSIGFSWDVFYRARGDTKPTLVFKAISEGWVFVVLLPAVALWGIDGAAWAVGSLGLIVVPIRQVFVRRLFPDVRLVGAAWRELLATGGAAALLLLVRTQWISDSLVTFAAQASVYLVVAMLGIVALDGRFLRDLVGRVRRPGQDGAALPAATSTLADRRTIAVPGRYPLGLAVDGDRVWVTCRDSSTIAWMQLPDGAWRSRRLPSYPHLPAINEGVAWVGLTLSGRVAAVEASGKRRVTRVAAHAREILVTAPWGSGCVAVENGRRHKRLWEIPASGGRPTARALPEGMVRPDFVVTSTDGDGEIWVGDTASPFLARIDGDAELLVAVPDGTRFAVRDDSNRLLWVGHTTLAVVSAISLDAPHAIVAQVEVPSVPFGLALDPSGLLWVACPEADRVVAVDRAGTLRESVDAERGAWPIGVAWWGSTLLVLCAKSATLLEFPNRSQNRWYQ